MLTNSKPTEQAERCRILSATKTKNMGKQFTFFKDKRDDVMIANTLKSVFGELLCVPFYKGELYPFDINTNERVIYLTSKSFQNNISYDEDKNNDGLICETLNRWKSPILEYRIPFQREDMTYVDGRFYCSTDNIEFSQIVSKFFRKLKKEFRYVKLWSCYISNSIDVETSQFFIPNRIITIRKEDLK